MAFVNENTITLTGAYVNADGSPASGSLTFVPEAFLTDAGAKQIIAPTALKVSLSGTGTFSIALPATDDPDINPIGWTYQVTEQIAGAPQRQFSMSLPYASSGATLDMAAIVPAASSTGTAAPYLLVPSGTPTVGQVPVVTTVSPLVLGWSAAVLSVAGRTGAVTLAKADVGLSNIDNTSDATKPVSTATAALLLTDVAATVTANGALAIGKHNPVDATSGARSMTLANASSAGQQASFEKVDGSVNAVTLTLNLRGTPSSTISLAWQFEDLHFVSKADGSWWPVAGHKTKTSLDAAYAAHSAPIVAALIFGD